MRGTNPSLASPIFAHVTRRAAKAVRSKPQVQPGNTSPKVPAMSITEAKAILKSSAVRASQRTNDPLGKSVESENSKLIEAQMVAINVMDNYENGELHSVNLPQRANFHWNADEIQQLREEFAAGKTIVEMAFSHQRTRRGIGMRLALLGLKQYESAD
jgi:hypothetical protein